MKRLSQWLGLVIIVAVALILIAGIALERAFRPPEFAAVAVPADQACLRGRVSEASGWLPFLLPGIADAQVVLQPGNHLATTDDSGWFSLAGIPAGVYTVTLAADGFETAVLADTPLPGGAITNLPEQALFAAPAGPPQARLKLGSLAPFGDPPDEYPYLTAVYLDATDSENISRDGIRFEIRDAQDRLLLDPHAPGESPLQPQRSAVPGTSPALYLFEPPGPGDYRVKLILTNDLAPGVEDTAELSVRAINTAPRALPRVVPGATLPRKVPDDRPVASSGLRVVRRGDPVFLLGQGLDLNHASPERYNPGGVAPDIYGKNHDHLQRQFDFTWTLQFMEDEGGDSITMNERLQGPAGNATTQGQLLHFVPERAGWYVASLRVSDNDPAGAKTSEPASVSILVTADNQSQDGSACAECHRDEAVTYSSSVHAGITCDNCHGPAAAHLAVPPGSRDYAAQKQRTQDISREAGLCGRCHRQYNEWEKSRHADGMPYGHLEIAAPLLVQCSKCHYAQTFARTVALARDAGIPFHDIDYKIRPAGIGPLMPDLSKVPAAGQSSITCVACHDPHAFAGVGSTGLRTADPGALCQTCHEEKWQNAVLEGTAGEIHNGYEYVGGNYQLSNPHNTQAKCVLCHLGDGGPLDANGVTAVGGHTLRMRDAGADGVPGGFGPRADQPEVERPGTDGDDVLHLGPCRRCHFDLQTFDRQGRQRAVYEQWTRLGELLRTANNGALPGVKPGDKCATCHRGGTLPFDDDPDLVLESAYLNYKLIRNDRSWGIHNPPYVQQLLTDSIAAVEAWLASRAGE